MSPRDFDFESLAHDLNQLLWAIQGRARVLAADLQSREPGGAAAARAIAEDATAAAAMLAGEDATSADPVGVARAAWRQARDQVAARGHDPENWSCDGPAAAPPVAAPPLVLRRILGNLFGNALEAMPGGGAVSWEFAREGDRVRIAVQDTGPGVATAVAGRLFEVGATADKAGGRGLGLAGSRALARGLGGELVHRPGTQGARFELTLPLAPTAPGDAAEPASSPTVPAPAVPLRILVADDEAPVREMLATLLASEGHEAALAADHDAALALWSPGRYHAALIDLSLPGRDGAELARSLRAREPALALVVITGWGRERELADLDPGLVDLVATKPIDLPRLRELLHDAARLSEARRGPRQNGE